MVIIIKVWLLLTFIACFVELYLGKKRRSYWIGGIIPLFFLLFGIYAWVDLWHVGVWLSALLAFFIPPVLLFCLYEIAYWYNKWQEIK